MFTRIFRAALGRQKFPFVSNDVEERPQTARQGFSTSDGTSGVLVYIRTPFGRTGLISLAALGLASCDPASGPVPAAYAETIPCAIGGATFDQQCTVERESAGGETILTLHQPDGGFHRLRVSGDGSIAAADGAETARVEQAGNGEVEVAIGDARYRLSPRAAPPAQ